LTPKLTPKNPLEEALDKLDLDSSLVLANILIQKVLYLRNQELSKAKVDKLLKPDTAIKIPMSINKPLAM
jgi:hypothetical protein